MINYVPRIRSTRTFLDLANHEQAQTAWPDVHEGVNSGPRSHHSMTKTLRNKWGVIGGWLLGAKTKGKQFNFDLSSQIKALQLMKEAKIPWPTKSVKRPTCSSALHRLLDDRIQEKDQSLKQTMPLHETNEPGISSQGHMALWKGREVLETHYHHLSTRNVYECSRPAIYTREQGPTMETLLGSWWSWGVLVDQIARRHQLCPY